VAETGQAPLAGIRVLEIAQAIAVPMCGLVLADMGAEVVKLEPPAGDSYRYASGVFFPGESKGFAIFNRGKQSVCLDLASPESRPAVEALVRQADVVLVAFKPPDVVRYGLDYGTLRTINPEMIYLEHIPLGPKGPYGQQGGYDVVVQGLSGLGSITAAPGDAPRVVQPAYADHATGFISALAVVTALRHRDLTGEGQRVETSLLSTALAMGANLLNWFAAVDPEPWQAFEERAREARAAGASFGEQQELYRQIGMAGSHGNIYFRHYRKKDGFISVGSLTPSLNERFRQVTGIDDPRTDPDFELGTPEAFDRLTAMIREAEDLFATRTTDEWLEAFRAVGSPCGPFHFPPEAFREPQILENNYLVELDHELLGPYRSFAPPFRMDATPVMPVKASPPLGVHTESALEAAGLPREDIDRLREAGVIGARLPQA
jgi:formyl-CoA transferase